VELGFADSTSYAQWLLSTPLTGAELHTLATYLTIGETYFFREPKTLDALAQRILPELIARRRGGEQRLRLWSAACATGEEAYSLAILLRQILPDWDDWHVTILATDINPRFLRKARAAEYGEWSFRESTPDFRERYFTRVGDKRFAVAPEIRSRVKFAPLNLALDPVPSLSSDTNAMDVILCRNLLIYFSPQQTANLIAKLHLALCNEGWLAVSPSECSQQLFSRFVTVNHSGAILYRKSNAPPPVPTYEPMVVPPPVPATPLPVPPPPIAEPAPSASEMTRTLANEGRLREALTWSERWIASDKLDASAHYMHAMVQQELGKLPEACASLKRALYLQPDFVLAHVALGNLEDGGKHFENALRLLRKLPPRDVVPASDGMTAGRLTEIVTALMPREGTA
jgi:chemotaxis protein methyltransferase CheR